MLENCLNLFQSPASWRINLLIIVIGESKDTWKGLHIPPPYLKKGNKHNSNWLKFRV